eukprot:TRINITY_DN4124_c0_g2_i1.p1 TRINITY_DN4124_c0_g2~~TRINITY_DN4124_c0_g2_i1.p1  ORF type:complete len:520 (-),score=71.57 TRINITY_DN4124_c0_g2_i1:44-1504(-)
MTAKGVCQCGTTVIFHGGLLTRTCWNCKAQLQAPSQGASSCGRGTAGRLRPPALSEAFPPSSEQRQLSPCPGAWTEPLRSSPGSTAALGGSRRSLFGQSEAPPLEQLHMPSMPGARSEHVLQPPEAPQGRLRTPSPAALREVPSMPPSPVPSDAADSTASKDWQQRDHMPPTETSTVARMLWLAGGLLAASVLLNFLMFRHRRGAALEFGGAETWPDGSQQLGSSQATGGQQPDTDGDGVPDHHDWCPQKRASKKTHGEETGWISGRASDFDGDGCEDGVEDKDKDNDGVEDKMDRCPMSPMQYRFVSNSVSDFDGDGCADGVEDLDDDGDGVANSIDECKETRLGDSSDTDGCSAKQRTARDSTAEGQLPGQQSSSEVTSEAPSAAGLSEEASIAVVQARPRGDSWMLSGWTATFQSIKVEVLLAAGLALALNLLKTLLRTVRVDTGPSLILQRCLFYGGFFCFIYAANVAWISKSTMGNRQLTS